MSPTVGYVLSVAAVSLAVQLRASYVERKSRRVVWDGKTPLDLRPAALAYLMPLWGGAFGVFMLGGAFGASGAAVLLYGMFGLWLVAVGVWWFCTLWGARVTIANGKLLYTEGRERREVLEDEVLGVRISWFSFDVRMRWDRRVSIPATFRSSEMILAFLRQAALNNAPSG